MPKKDKFTTIRVYETDKAVLIRRYGAPTHKAIGKALENCPHPEDKRTYVVAALPLVDQDAITVDSKRRTVGGFYCSKCERYVFQKAALQEPVAS